MVVLQAFFLHLLQFSKVVVIYHTDNKLFETLKVNFHLKMQSIFADTVLHNARSNLSAIVPAYIKCDFFELCECTSFCLTLNR